MTNDNDEVFNFILDEEFNKIPFLFRFNKRRVKITLGIMCAGIAAMCICSTAAKCIDGAVAIIASAAFTALIAGWMSLATVFEKRAFSRASAFVFKYRVSEREGGFTRAQSLKLLNR